MENQTVSSPPSLAPRSGDLRIRELSKTYPGRQAVSGLNLDIAEGEFISLLGPSGCGKTTTLHMIAGFIAPDHGDILLGGKSLRNVPSHRRGAAMVFQNYALFPHLSVFDNVAFGLRMARTPRNEITRRVGEALDLVRLQGMDRHYPRELSGGQQQRVALARALVLKPRLLLLDEPLSNLDAALRRTLRQEFIDIHRLTSMTTILVTHDLEEAFATSHRIAVLSHGKLQQFDTPRQIYRHPLTRFVAEYLGHENILEGHRLTGVSNTMRINAADLDIEVPAPRSDLTHASEEHVRYALPAQQVRLALSSTHTSSEAQTRQNRHATHHGRLATLSYLGATVRFSVDVQGLILWGEQPAGAWCDGLETGVSVEVRWTADDLIELPGN